MAILSIFIPLAIGLLLGAALLLREGKWREWMLVACLAPAIGIAISSSLYFFWILALGPNRAMPFFLVLEGAILLLTLLFFRKRWRNGLKLPRFQWKGRPHPTRWSLMTWVGLIAGLVLVVSLANFLEDWALAFFASPDGGWDAWAIWNLHARFIYSGEGWRAGFTPTIIWWSHPDYPWLLPAFIAQVWGFLGNPSKLLPALVELAFLLGIMGVMVFGVSQARGWKAGIFAGLFTLPILHPSLDFQQYADMPLVLFILAANLMLWFAGVQDEKKSHYLLLAGFLAGAAVWTKNEGWALIAALALVEGITALVERPKASSLLKRWLWLAAGFAPMLAAVLAFKYFVAPPNDLVEVFQWSDIGTRLLTLSRYRQIGESFLQDLQVFEVLKVTLPLILLAYVLVVGWTNLRRQNLATLWILARVLVILLVYFGVFLVDPKPLSWHLATSMIRLIAHLLPSLVLAAFLLARSFERESLPGEEALPPH